MSSFYQKEIDFLQEKLREKDRLGDAYDSVRWEIGNNSEIDDVIDRLDNECMWLRKAISLLETNRIINGD